MINLNNIGQVREAAQAAYMAGDTVSAVLCDKVGDLLEQVDMLEDMQTLEAWERNNGPAEAYKQFFYDCFERLAGYYSCPSITSDYDKGVIFESIEKGSAL